MPRVVAPTPEAIAAAAEALGRGELVAFPTETVYGLGAAARDPAAVARIFAAKGRPADHPLIVHLASAEGLPRWAAPVPDAAWRLAEAFWPGPLTLILPRAAGVPDAVTGGQLSVGLRCPDHPVAQALLRAFGDGVAAPSANRFGRISPTRAEHVIEELGDRVAWVLDGGPSAVGVESTIVSLVGARPRLLRPGAVGRAALERVLGAPLDAPPSEAITTPTPEAPRAPGTLASHYAPTTPAERVPPDALDARLGTLAETYGEAGLAVLARREAPEGFAGHWRRLPNAPEAAAHALYAALRDLDRSGARRIVIEDVPAGPAWEAVADRLARATFRAPDEASPPGSGGGAAARGFPYFRR